MKNSEVQVSSLIFRKSGGADLVLANDKSASSNHICIQRAYNCKHVRKEVLKAVNSRCEHCI